MSSSDLEVITLFKQKGLKATPQRLAIFKYLINNHTHPSAEDVFLEIKKDLPTISQGTVYKTLATLVEIGVIRELKMANGQSRYDSNIKVHINIICPNCNKISDFQSEEVLEFWNSITGKISGTITGQRFDIYRLCENCNTKS